MNFPSHGSCKRIFYNPGKIGWLKPKQANLVFSITNLLPSIFCSCEYEYV